uniref:Uncharacterized protein n=1 Tax=Oryza nivara TaxID=4536 RepID=A0A0E0IF77_ORYNI
MEATVVSVGKSVLDGALTYAKSAIAEEVTLQLGVQRDQGFIRDELEMMQSFLLVADKEHGHHEVLKTWVKQVRDVAYDVEDCLQDYAVRLEKPSWWRLPCTMLRERHRIANEMKELRAKVEDVSQRNMRYNLLGGSAAASKSSPITAAELQSTTIDDIEARRAAKQQEKVDLVQLITKNGHGLGVIAVWGTSGAAGTASIVRVAYQKVKGEFKCHAWVRLMHPFNAKEFIGNLVRQFKANSCEGIGMALDRTPSGVSVLNEMEAPDYNLLHDFSGYVSNNKYLIVLNGVSTIEEWDWIKTYLPNNDNGSRILVCTQQAEVASCCTEDGYKVSEMLQDGSFIKPLYVFYNEIKDSLTEQQDKAESSSNTTASVPSRTLQSVLEETEFIKLQKEPKSEIIELISKGGKVISVWGIGDGVEKSTALMRSVYDNLSDRFQRHAWFSMKCQFSHEKFIKTLVAQFHEGYTEDTEGTTDRKLQDDAQDSKTKMGTTESTRSTEWDFIVKNLPSDSNPANRIVVTTGEFSVAIHCSGEKQYTYKLETSNDKDAFSLLKMRVNSRLVSSDSTQMKSENKSSVDTADNTTRVHFDKMVQDDDLENLPGSILSPPKNFNTVAMKELTRSKTMLIVEEAQLIGRGKEKEEVIKLLSNRSPYRQVISVWGMGGIGKTTLVRSIYQSSELEKLKFERRAWVTVLRPFQPTELLRSLAQRLVEDSPGKKGESTLGGVTRNDLSIMAPKDLSEKLIQDLTGKKYLIVLDDLSSPVEWDLIIRNLPRNNNGSRIIVTTRPKGIARHCSNKEKNMHNIEGLTDEDALELFFNKVTPPSSLSPPPVSKESDDSELKPDMIYILKEKPEMMEEAKIIIKKCGRLPLAIAAVGGFLSTRPQNITEWRKFSDHISAELDNNPSLEMINKILISSYEGLSYHLKSCFLYLSIFPEDHNIRHGRLLRRWIAEGYSRATRNKNAEKEAEEQFMILLNKSMIQQSRTITSNSGKTGFCQLHDLMREISVSKSEEENLVLVLDDHSTSRSKDKVRHLVVSQTWSRKKKNDMQNIVDVSHIRSLTVFGEWKSFFISKKMRMLRVLDLEDARGLQDHDLVPVGKLRHLKYLSLRGSEYIENLPHSFGNLSSLETLDIRGTWVTILPATFIKLQKLQFLHAGATPANEIDMRNFNLIPVIKSALHKICLRKKDTMDVFESHIWRMTNAWLRNLDLCGVATPSGIGKLRSLHTLGVVNITTGNSILKELDKLSQLRKLGVTGINKNNCKDLCSAIVNHGRLQALLLRAEGQLGLEGCLDGLSPPPEALESLKLYGNLVILPEWVNQLENLRKLSLRSTNLEVNATMHVLGKLPMLTILRLQDKTCKEKELSFCPGSFTSLTMLELVSWEHLSSVIFEERATPKLEVLRVDHCWHIDDVGISGIDTLACLQEVSLEGYYYSEFKEYLQEQLGMNKNKPNLKIL